MIEKNPTAPEPSLPKLVNALQLMTPTITFVSFMNRWMNGA